MQIVAKEESMWEYLKTAVEVDQDKPVLVDHYVRGKEVEVDAVCDGKRVFVPGIMERYPKTRKRTVLKPRYPSEKRNKTR